MALAVAAATVAVWPSVVSASYSPGIGALYYTFFERRASGTRRLARPGVDGPVEPALPGSVVPRRRWAVCGGGTRCP